jgi:hypothetical protein
MEHLIENLIDHLIDKRKIEIGNIEKYEQNDVKDLILITSGKIVELDSIIQELNDLLGYNLKIKSAMK